MADRNFAAQLSFLDALFGTFHMPSGQLPAVSGSAYGLYGGPIDAVAGPGTVRATKAFQRRAAGISATQAGVPPSG